MRLFIHIVILMMLAACGHRQNPTGGKQDTTKPEILATNPAEFQDISTMDLEIVFSKPIDRSTIIGGVHVYPEISNKKYKWDKNNLIIQIHEKLQQNTNYYFTFTTRIKGERGNQLDRDYTFIFASGELNSCRLSGKIDWEKPDDKKNATTLKLMSADSTYIMTKQITTQTYSLENLNLEDHIIEAFTDLNKNNKYDYGREPFFYHYQTAARLASINIHLAYEDTLKPKIKSVDVLSENQLTFHFDKPVKQFDDLYLSTQELDFLIPQIIATSLQDQQLSVLCTKMDTIRYQAVFKNLTDFKANSSDSVSISFDGIAVPDSIPPRVESVSPRNGSTIETWQPEIKISFSEIILNENLSIELEATETKKKMPVKVISGNSKQIILTPQSDLQNYTTYELRISARDISQNKTKEISSNKFIVVVR